MKRVFCVLFLLLAAHATAFAGEGEERRALIIADNGEIGDHLLVVSDPATTAQSEQRLWVSTTGYAQVRTTGAVVKYANCQQTELAVAAAAGALPPSTAFGSPVVTPLPATDHVLLVSAPAAPGQPTTFAVRMDGAGAIGDNFQTPAEPGVWRTCLGAYQDRLRNASTRAPAGRWFWSFANGVVTDLAELGFFNRADAWPESSCGATWYYTDARPVTHLFCDSYFDPCQCSLSGPTCMPFGDALLCAD